MSLGAEQLLDIFFLAFRNTMNKYGSTNPTLVRLEYRRLLEKSRSKEELKATTKPKSAA